MTDKVAKYKCRRYTEWQASRDDVDRAEQCSLTSSRISEPAIMRCSMRPNIAAVVGACHHRCWVPAIAVLGRADCAAGFRELASLFAVLSPDDMGQARMCFVLWRRWYAYAKWCKLGERRVVRFATKSCAVGDVSLLTARVPCL